MCIQRRDIGRCCTVLSFACRTSTSKESADFTHAALTEALNFVSQSKALSKSSTDPQSKSLWNGSTQTNFSL
jgi:hypothetical protein